MADARRNANIVGPRLTKRVAIITGGAGGIGEAIAKRLVLEGASVAIVDVDETRGQSIVHGLALDGGGALFLHCDVTSREQVRRSVEVAEDKLGPITILVNNAGIGLRAPFLEMSDNVWNKVVNVNLTAAFIVAQEVPKDSQEWWRKRCQYGVDCGADSQ